MELKDWIGIGAFLISVVSLTLATIALRRTTSHNQTIRQYASAAPDIALSSQINQARMMITTIAIKIADRRAAGGSLPN